MKKSLFIALFAAMMMVAAPAMAGWFSPVEVDGYDYGFAADPDHSGSVSLWGHGNDNAVADALGGGGFEASTYALGLGYASESIDGFARGESDTWSYAKDYGKTSKAGAGAKIEGCAVVDAEAFGFFGYSHVEGYTFFAGSLSQANNANEVGYAYGDGVSAGNNSFVSFDVATKGFEDTGFLFCSADGKDKIHGEALTLGKSEVTIDNTGDHRYVKAETFTKSEIDSSVCRTTAFMSGAGGVNGQISNQYGAVAGGGAAFSYTSRATDSARGAASLDAQIRKTSGSTTVSVHSSSYATTY